MSAKNHTSGCSGFNRAVVFHERQSRLVKRAEDLSHAPHVALDLLLVIACGWRTYSPTPESVFDSTHNPGIVWYGKQKGPRLTSTPFQVFDCRLL
jgi:hypothetical protein